MELTPAKKILYLIETVDPSYTVALDEIDVLVFEYIKGKKPPFKLKKSIYSYTRSRDALKAIRPDGWDVSFFKVDKLCTFTLTNFKLVNQVTGYELPTEELAELNAIIKAIEWERNNKL